MPTTTTNFGWTVPSDTDLVKDGAAAIRTALGGVDTSMVDLKGGTTGQVLSKASGTDMDFTWVAQDDSNAIQNAIVDAKGDLIAATAADTPARLPVGTNGQVLTADSTTATGLAWATASGSAGPSFKAYIGTSQTLSAATWTKLAFNTEIWDTDADYDTATYRFTPGSAGKYSVDVSCFMYDGPEYRLALWKNGAEAAFMDIKDDTSVQDKNPNLQGSTAIDMNGSTDYIEVYGFMRAGATRRVDAGSTGSWFTATWMRS